MSIYKLKLIASIICLIFGIGVFVVMSRQFLINKSDKIENYYGIWYADSFEKSCINSKCFSDDTKPDSYVKNKSEIVISKDFYKNYITSIDGYIIEQPIYVREIAEDKNYKNNKVFYVYGKIKGFPYHDNLSQDKLKEQINTQIKNKNYVALILVDKNGNIIEQKGMYNFSMKKQ